MIKKHKEKVKFYQNQVLERTISGHEREMKNLLNGRLSYVSLQQTAVLKGDFDTSETYAATLSKNMVKILALVDKSDRAKTRTLVLSADKHRATITTIDQPIRKKGYVEEAPKSKRKFSFDEVKSIAEYTFDYEWNVIISQSRDRDLVEARQILFVFLKSQGLSLLKAGKILGGRDHSTGVHSSKSFYNNCEVDSSYRAKANRFLGEVSKNGYFLPKSLYENYEGYIRIGGFDLDNQPPKTVNAKLKIREWVEPETNLA